MAVKQLGVPYVWAIPLKRDPFYTPCHTNSNEMQVIDRVILLKPEKAG